MVSFFLQLEDERNTPFSVELEHFRPFLVCDGFRAMLQQFFRKNNISTTWGLRALVNSTIYFEKGLCSFVVRKVKREYAIVLLSLYYYVFSTFFRKVHIF